MWHFHKECVFRILKIQHVYSKTTKFLWKKGIVKTLTINHPSNENSTERRLSKR